MVWRFRPRPDMVGARSHHSRKFRWNHGGQLVEQGANDRFRLQGPGEGLGESIQRRKASIPLFREMPLPGKNLVGFGQAGREVSDINKRVSIAEPLPNRFHCTVNVQRKREIIECSSL